MVPVASPQQPYETSRTQNSRCAVTNYEYSIGSKSALNLISYLPYIIKKILIIIIIHITPLIIRVKNVTHVDSLLSTA